MLYNTSWNSFDIFAENGELEIDRLLQFLICLWHLAVVRNVVYSSPNDMAIGSCQNYVYRDDH